MKKLLLITIFAAITSLVFAQYDSDRLPSGLETAASLDSADYVILQKAGETYVKAIPAYYFISLVTDVLGDLDPLTVESLIVNSVSYLDSIVLNSVPISTISGESGRMLSADGSGWIDTVPAKYEGDNAYSFGQRAGSVGNWSFITGFENEASGVNSGIFGGRDNTASGHFSSNTGGYYNTASGLYSSNIGGRYNTASGLYSSNTGGGSNTASGLYSAILNGSEHSAAGEYSTIINGKSDTITTDHNIILNSNSCSINTAEFNTINSSQSVSASGVNNFISGSQSMTIDGNNNTIFNSFNSDIASSRMFLAHSALSQYKGADSVSFVFGSLYDTVDISSSFIAFTGKNTGAVKESNISMMGNQTWTDTIYQSFLFNSDFYNDTATRIDNVAAFHADEFAQKAGLMSNFTAASDYAYFSNDKQWVCGTWNDSTDASCDRLLSIGNGTAAGFRSDAFNVFSSGVGIFGGAIGLGDTATVCGLTSTAQEGMIANDENGDLMQFDGIEWQKFNKESTDYKFGAYVPAESTQTTTTTAAGTYYFVGTGDNNKFVNYINQGFSFDGDTLTYTGIDTLWFKYDGSLTVSVDTNNITVGIAVMINDSIIPQTCQSMKMAIEGDLYNVKNSGLIRLATNDKVKFMIRSDNAGAVITTENFSVTLTKQ